MNLSAVLSENQNPSANRPTITTVRIAILGTRGIPARYGGFETFAEELSLRLARDSRFHVTVVCPTEGEGPLPPLEGVKRLGVPNRQLGPFTTIIYDLLSLWACRKDYDLVYMLGYAASPFLLIPRIWGTRVWVNMDGLEWRRSKWNLFGRLYLRLTEWIASWSSNCMIADAKAIQDYLLNRYGTARNCRFLAYGANTTVPDYVVPLAHGLVPCGYLLVVARLEPENQVEEIIEGYLASSCTLPLVVVGGLSPETPYVKRLKLLAGDRVMLLGQVYDRNLLNSLRAQAFASFHGHTVGGTNPSLLEAIGAGRPIIAHDNVFNREVVGELACYFSGTGDIPTLLRDAVPGMAADISLFERSQARLSGNYSWDAITESYKCEIFNDLSYADSEV